MKLLRVGELGKEQVAALDSNNIIRDLSKHIEDLTPQNFNDTTLSKLKSKTFPKKKKFTQKLELVRLLKIQKITFVLEKIFLIISRN